MYFDIVCDRSITLACLPKLNQFLRNLECDGVDV